MIELENFAKFNNGNYLFVKDSWFNGHCYMPLEIHKVLYQYKNYQISIRYENRKSEFNKTNVLNDGSYADRHLVTILVVCQNVNGLKFRVSIDKRFFFSRLTRLNIKTKSKRLLNWLKSNKHLQILQQTSNKSAEFTPEIRGSEINGIYSIEVNYNTELKNIEVLLIFNDFLIDFINYLLGNVTKGSVGSVSNGASGIISI